MVTGKSGGRRWSEPYRTWYTLLHHDQRWDTTKLEITRSNEDGRSRISNGFECRNRPARCYPAASLREVAMLDGPELGDKGKGKGKDWRTLGGTICQMAATTCCASTEVQKSVGSYSRGRTSIVFVAPSTGTSGTNLASLQWARCTSPDGKWGNLGI